MSQETIQFQQWACHIKLGHYANKRLAIQLVSAVEDLSKNLFLGEPIGTVSVNVPEININDNQVIIKDYSENAGILQVLVDNGYVSNPKAVNIGFVNVHVADKTEKLLQLEEQQLSKPKTNKMR